MSSGPDCGHVGNALGMRIGVDYIILGMGSELPGLLAHVLTHSRPFFSIGLA
jgi:hypothetical protein